MSLYRRAMTAIQSAQNALLVCHIDPDCDTLGSMLGFSYLLDKQKVPTTLYCASEIPSALHFLPKIKQIRHQISSRKPFDLLATFDAGTLSRLELGKDPHQLARIVLNIDHHPDNQRYGDINLVEPKAAATGEVVYQLFKRFRVPLTEGAATSLYAALITDTGNFRYENTSIQTFQMAAELMKRGAKPTLISQAIYERRSEVALRLLGLAMQRMKQSKPHHLVWSTLPLASLQRLQAKDEDANGLIDMLRSIDQVDVAIIFREVDKNRVKVNFRAKKVADVGKLARQFGGGGHIRAAGCLLKGPLPTIEWNVIQAAKRHLSQYFPRLG